MIDKTRIIYTDTNHTELGYLNGCILDLVTGDDECNFQLKVPQNKAKLIENKSLIYCEPLSCFGGIVYGGFETSKKKSESSAFGSTKDFAFTGQTWEGCLMEKAVDPKDSPILHVEGDLNECLWQILSACNGLTDMFEVDQSSTGIYVSHDLERVTNAWSAIRRMLKAYGYKLKIKKDPINSPKLYTEPIEFYGDVDGQNRCDYKISWDTPYNSILAFGKGEMENRAVVRLFADEDRKISEKQTQFGFDERQYIYEYTTDDIEALHEDAWKKLEGFQNTDSIRIDLPPDRVFDIGDVICVTSPITGRSAKAEVNKTIVEIGKTGSPTVTNEVGDPVWEGQIWRAIRT